MRRIVMGMLLVLSVALTGCGDADDNPIFGTWHGTITEEQRHELDIKKVLERNRLELVFQPKLASVNGEEFPVQYNKNMNFHFINIDDTNLTMAIIFNEDGTRVWRSPSRHSRGVVEIPVTKVR